jgi:VWFA-related protein
MRFLLVSILSLPMLWPAHIAAQTPTFRTGVTDVSVNPEVLDRGRPVRNLLQSDFLLFDEGQLQQAVYFGRESVPLDLVLLLDVSGSVRKYLRDVAAIATEALKQLQPNDRVAVMTFSRRTWIEQAFTTDAEEVSEAIQKSATEPPQGAGTRIYAAITSAASYLRAQKTSEVRRRAILMITDNNGMSYDVHQDQALRSLFDAAVTFDSIVVGRHPHPPAPEPGSVINPDFAFDDVFPLTEQTGGEAIVTTKPKDSLAGMLARLRERYLLVYPVPQNASAGSFRRIRVELAPSTKKKYPRAAVHARGGYYVSGPEEDLNK